VFNAWKTHGGDDNTGKEGKKKALFGRERWTSVNLQLSSFRVRLHSWLFCVDGSGWMVGNRGENGFVVFILLYTELAIIGCNMSIVGPKNIFFACFR
jgi:hypothetical protein